jgi:diguanylate cyclase (GGDEF)-like protein
MVERIRGGGGRVRAGRLRNYCDACEEVCHDRHRLKERVQQLRRLGELMLWLLACTTEEEALELLGPGLERLFAGYRVVLTVIGASGDEITVRLPVSRADSAATFAPGDCWALRLGRPHVVCQSGDFLTGPVCRHWEEPLPRSCLCLPLNAQQQCLGVLHLARMDGRPPGKRVRAWAATVAEQLSMALSHLRTRESLQRQALHDSLTGLHNHQYGVDFLTRALAQAARKQTPVAIALLDVDRLKALNIQLGYVAVNALLKRLALCLQNSCRKCDDSVSRYGGDECLLVLGSTTAAVARERAEELRRACSILEVPHGDRILGPIKVSVGVAAYPDHGTDPQSLLVAAERAVFLAKASGGNQVVVAQGPQMRRAGDQ